MGTAGRSLVLVHLGRYEEAESRAEELRGVGYAVAVVGRTSATGLRRRMDQEYPDAVVIDLSRVPSEGQAAGLTLLTYRPTRDVPIIFVGGAAEAVARVRSNVPDGVFCPWSRVAQKVVAALARGRRPPRSPPRSVFDPYRGVALAKKLGIKAGAVVALVGAPAGFEPQLAPLPEGVSVRHGSRGRHDLLIWFVKSGRALDDGIATVAARMGPDGLWIAWPKKASTAKTDLSHASVQKAGLGAGLMDYKICSMDDTWSALRFTRRR